MKTTRGYALALSLLVTFLWSSSFVLVKIGLKEINPLALVSSIFYCRHAFSRGCTLQVKKYTYETWKKATV
ncbi:MAG: hypothetical protein ACXQTP_01750 [Candidatus Methanofastidiosia archaeon]